MPPNKLAEIKKDFTLITRQDGDNGEKRTLPTPEPEVILRKLDKFEEKWFNDLSAEKE